MEASKVTDGNHKKSESDNPKESQPAASKAEISQNLDAKPPHDKAPNGGNGQTPSHNTFPPPPPRDGERRLAVTDWITAISTFVIMGWAGLQWYELHSGGTDTHTLADAAGKQVTAAQNFASSAADIQTKIEETERDFALMAKNSGESIKATQQAMRLDQRAWVGSSEWVVTAPEVGGFVHGQVQWTNSGKTFARKVLPAIHLVFRQNPVMSDAELLKLDDSAAMPTGSIGNLFPGGHANSAVDGITPITEAFKAHMINDWYTYLWGEMTYADIFSRPHETTFCGYRKGIKGDLVQCTFHNDAD